MRYSWRSLAMGKKTGMGRNTLGSSDTGELKARWVGEIEIIEKDRHDIRVDRGCN